MLIKELDVVKLKDGQTATILVAANGHDSCIAEIAADYSDPSTYQEISINTKDIAEVVYSA